MVIAREGMCAYDACRFNKDVLGLPGAVETLIKGMASFDVNVIDTQTYYHAVYTGPKKMPEMRNSG